MSADPLKGGSITQDKDPWDSNQALPTLLTGRYRVATKAAVPELTLRSLDRFSFLGYPLSGGFQGMVAVACLHRPCIAARRMVGAKAAGTSGRVPSPSGL
jgi:hypothetical protein